MILPQHTLRSVDTAAPILHLNAVTSEIPAVIESLGPAATFAWEEFFHGQIRNPHTRRAYERAIRDFIDWLGPGAELPRVTPGEVGRYFDAHHGSIPTKKLALAALRACFDVMVQRHVLILNPAASVRGERYRVVEGATPEISARDARLLLDSISRDRPVDHRDRCLIGTLIFTAARSGAVSALRHKDLVTRGGQSWLQFLEKGGVRREIPVRHDLAQDFAEYRNAAFFGSFESSSPFFPACEGRTGALTDRPMSVTDIGRMVKRRVVAAGLSHSICTHSFRVGTVTNLLSQGVPLEDVQHLAGHADPRTTRIYDRRNRQVSRNIVERISV